MVSVQLYKICKCESAARNKEWKNQGMTYNAGNANFIR